MTCDLGVVIASYNRADRLLDCLWSMKANFIDRLKFLKIHVFIYGENYPTEHRTALEEKCPWVQFNWLDKQGQCVGAANRNAVLQSGFLQSARYLMIVDDDTLFLHQDNWFDKQFYSMLEQMSNKQASILCGRLTCIGMPEFAIKPLPDDALDEKPFILPGREKFSLLRVQGDTEEVFFPEVMTTLRVGEDEFLYLRALLMQKVVLQAYGLKDIIHLAFEAFNLDLSPLKGGLLQRVHEDGNASANSQTKYGILQAQGSCYALYPDLFIHDPSETTIMRDDWRETIQRYQEEL